MPDTAAQGVAVKVALCTLLLALPGCARFEPRPIDPAESAARFQEHSLGDAALRAFVASNLDAGLDDGPDFSWSLDALTLAAFYFHPELEVARAQWGVAEAALTTAGERPGPGASVAPGRNVTTGIPSPWLVTANVDLTLETAGKRGYRITEAAQLAEAARRDMASVAWQVRSRVRETLLGLYGAQESGRLLKQQQAIHAENVRILEGRYRAGAISAFVLIQARLAADSARLALHDAERREAEARAQLASAVGVPVAAFGDVDFSFGQFEALPAGLGAADARQQALLNRADILAALARYAASQSALQLAIARQYPDVHIGPGYEYDQGDNKWSLGLSIMLPASRNRGAIAEARARREEAAARFNALQAKVLGEIDLAVAAYRAASQKQADASAMLADLERQEGVAKAMFEAGAISRGDLAALQLQLGVSALARLDAVLQVQQAVGQLEDAVQNPLELPSVVWEEPRRAAASAGGSGSE